MTKTFITRTISALVAVLIIFGIYYFFKIPGLKIICYLAVFTGSLELIRILLPKEIHKTHKVLFCAILMLIFHIAANAPSFLVIAFPLAFIVFMVLSIMAHQGFAELETMVRYQGASVLGFVYLGLLPSYAYRLLDLKHGLGWFSTLLVVVFAGDIGAYLLGVLIGKNKVLPRLSPKKTWEGSLGGLLGSTLAGYGCSYFLPEIQLNTLLVMALCAGFVAQFGDFFESLLKRTAGVKDSGKIMPGHGGVLDRLDGVLFASPIILLVASLFESGL